MFESVESVESVELVELVEFVGFGGIFCNWMRITKVVFAFVRSRKQRTRQEKETGHLLTMANNNRVMLHCAPPPPIDIEFF